EAHYWLRAQWAQGEYIVTPRLKAVLLNTVWASNRIKITNETLGSSNAEAFQRFEIASSRPILPGQSGEGRYDGIWKERHERRARYKSTPSDTHYTLDRLRGSVRFGNGQHGMIPPEGIGNIRITYWIGGGERGNVPAGAINQMKTTVPGVNAVVNLTEAMGGANVESVEQIKLRGPRVLRHCDRAVTLSDYADLVLEN